ncbi:acidocalcisomal exopolyphosphatase, putative [Trypanosoma cruzi marinkellei]|uniref:Acidocalcisomal exopolyphosphatase, putative n=1 Tax=Trypanosoma cruzi marinkellei TaxID=85056 RepID=K2MZ60_TRYCR|nr:acidocalcisomal exopolyphosphatase, putative [Trypanosoma cruzi marinkellei]
MVAVINDFLKRGAGVFAARMPFTIVLGNDGGDMDSIIGSIYLSMYLEKRADLGGGSYIPALNFEQEDLPLRNDVIKLFSKHGIATDYLLSVKGKPGASGFLDLKSSQANVILYDHNKLIPEQRFLCERVVGVIDHHFDEKLYLDSSSQFRRIESTGSACTLVAELFQEAELTVPCPELLLAPIVLDTVNFDPSQKKVTEKDIMISQWLIRQASVSIDSKKMFFELSAWKNDILGLTFPQHFRRDYKDFEFSFGKKEDKQLQIGISSISCRFDEFLGSRGMVHFTSNCLEFLLPKKLDAFLLAFAGERGSKNYCRQLAFIARGILLEALKEFAESSPEGICFTLIDRAEQKGWELMCYELSDPSVSRKRLAPSLMKFFASWPKL